MLKYKASRHEVSNNGRTLVSLRSRKLRADPPVLMMYVRTLFLCIA
jgi:hypothetical protein